MTMIHLPLKEYSETLDKNLKAFIGTTKHFYEDADSIWLFFKNVEHWEYYTRVPKADIVSFGQSYEINAEGAINDFKLTYCTNALQAVSLPVELTEKPVETLQDYEIEETNYAEKSTNPQVVEEAEDYGAFFEKQVDKWETGAVKAVEHIEIEKTFGEFLQHMTNAVNSSAFMTRVRKFIKSSMTEGLEAAEAELDVQVGADSAFRDRVKALEHQQLNGYTINGKHWHGIRGATAETRLEVLRVVEEGVKEKKTKQEIAKEVRDVFQGATMAQAKRITRTETTRFVNEGKLHTYKESGIEGLKAWSVVPVQCCDECNEMGDRYDKGIPFHDDFVTKDGRRLQHPPLHPNCRCVIEYREP